MPLTISQMRDCVETYLINGGHDMSLWYISEPYDTRASTRIPVYAVGFRSQTYPFSVIVRESWELRGGMEHGTRDISGVLTITSDSTISFNVDTEESIVYYLSKQVPIGAELTRQIEAEKAKKATIQTRMDELVTLTNSVSACIKDEFIDELVQSVARETRRNNLPTSSFPMLKICLANEIDNRVRRRINEAFDALVGV